jgi:chromate reductase, NAD(P)H dehydrogenase (quinone)
MSNLNVAMLTGSLRKESFSRKMGRAISSVPAPGLTFSILEIGDLPHYNEDYEADPPPVFTRFRAAIAAADAILFVTPEFNRGIPGVLKNAIDVGSRPWGKSVWNGKIAAVISTSTGAVGGFGAHFALRQSLSSVNVATMPHPEAYIGNVASLFDASGKLVDPSTTEFVTGFLASFRGWIERLRPRTGA